MVCCVQADREKKSAEEEAERQKEEVRLVAEMERNAAEQAQRDYEQDLEDKLLRLPEEPVGTAEGAITVMIRTPKGGRFGRRYGISITHTNRLRMIVPDLRTLTGPDW